MKKKVLKILLVVGLLIPMFTIALSDAARAEKEALETEFDNLKPIAMTTLDDVNTFLNDCGGQISDEIKLVWMDEIYDNVRDRDFAALIETLKDNVDFEGQCEADVIVLHDEIDSQYPDFIDHARDWHQFLRKEASNMAYNDVYPLILDNQDIAIRSFKVIDNMVDILDNSHLSSDDYEALIMGEFPEHMDLIFGYRDTALEIANDRLTDGIDDILADDSRTNAQQIDAIINLIDLMEDVRADLVSFHSDLQNNINNNQLKQFVANKKAEATTEMDAAIIAAKRQLILEMGRSELETNIGEPDTETLIESVYGLEVTPNIHTLLDHVKDLVIFNLYNNRAAVETLLNTNYGSLQFIDLVAGNKIKTGSRVRVIDESQNLLEYTFIVKGDLLGRAKSDITDLITLIDFVLGDISLSPIATKAADINNDNKHDITDIVDLIDLILG